MHAPRTPLWWPTAMRDVPSPILQPPSRGRLGKPTARRTTSSLMTVLHRLTRRSRLAGLLLHCPRGHHWHRGPQRSRTSGRLTSGLPAAAASVVAAGNRSRHVGRVTSFSSRPEALSANLPGSKHSTAAQLTVQLDVTSDRTVTRGSLQPNRALAGQGWQWPQAGRHSSGSRRLNEASATLSGRPQSVRSQWANLSQWWRQRPGRPWGVHLPQLAELVQKAGGSEGRSDLAHFAARLDSRPIALVYNICSVVEKHLERHRNSA
mmetsp:Transcript_1804/g.5250  ORF Transcript_1804/g.5250 Transcript_1804/m.5250 type:complete len:263 (-) Transcript_1804:165-953(-)